MAAAASPQSLATIRDTFSLLDDWEDRYRYIVELGRDVPSLSEADKTPANYVHGCQSQVWIVADEHDGRLKFRLDSDALIVRGLIAILLAAFDDKTPAAVLEFDIDGLFDELDLRRHLSPTRGNGLAALVQRIREIARAHT